MTILIHEIFILYLTVNLPDIKESSLEYTLKSTTISFKAKAGVWVLFYSIKCHHSCDFLEIQTWRSMLSISNFITKSIQKFVHTAHLHYVFILTLFL